VCALRVSRWHIVFIYFLLELEVLAHRLMIIISGNDAPKIVPDKSLGSGLVFRIAVTVVSSHIFLGTAMASGRFMKHGLNHILFVFKRRARGMGGRRRGGAFVLLDCQETIRKKAMTANEWDSQARM
jgi:hypothetical protein